MEKTYIMNVMTSINDELHTSLSLPPQSTSEFRTVQTTEIQIIQVLLYCDTVELGMKFATFMKKLFSRQLHKYFYRILPFRMKTPKIVILKKKEEKKERKMKNKKNEIFQAISRSVLPAHSSCIMMQRLVSVHLWECAPETLLILHCFPWPWTCAYVYSLTVMC